MRTLLFIIFMTMAQHFDVILPFDDGTAQVLFWFFVALDVFDLR